MNVLFWGTLKWRHRFEVFQWQHTVLRYSCMNVPFLGTLKWTYRFEVLWYERTVLRYSVMNVLFWGTLLWTYRFEVLGPCLLSDGLIGLGVVKCHTPGSFLHLHPNVGRQGNWYRRPVLFSKVDILSTLDFFITWNWSRISFYCWYKDKQRKHNKTKR